MVAPPTKLYRVMASTGYAMDYIGSWLIAALFASMFRGFLGSVFISVVCWMVMIVALLLSACNFVPSCIQAYRISKGYAQKRFLATIALLSLAITSYVYAIVLIIGIDVVVGGLVIITNTVATAWMCTITRSTPRWALLPR